MGVRINAHRSDPCRESSKLCHWSCTIRIVTTALSRRGKNPLKWIWIGPPEYAALRQRAGLTQPELGRVVLPLLSARAKHRERVATKVCSVRADDPDGDATRDDS